MAQERPSTPEKQLLNLIEDPKGLDLSQKKIKRRSFTFFSFAALRGRLSFFRDSLRSGGYKNFLLDIKSLNRVLRICVVLLAVYLAGNFTMSFVRLKEIPDFTDKNPRSTSDLRSEDATDKKIAYYLEGPRGRDIFKFGDVSEEKAEEIVKEEVAAPVEVTESPASVLAGQLGLVGIGWSDDPDVMVENVETKKMYFLKKGQRIDGMIKIEAIFEDKVILTYDNGKELELR